MLLFFTVLSYMKKSVIFIDASCIGNPWPMEYRAVNKKKEELFRSKTFPLWTNNIGEFLAIIDAIQYIQSRETKGHKIDTTIYTDSQTALHRLASKKPKTTLPHNNQTKELLTKLQEAVVRLKKTDISAYDIQKRNTEKQWEIPADFGRK